MVSRARLDLKKNEQVPLFFPLRPSDPAAGTSPLLTPKVLLFILRPLAGDQVISGMPSGAAQAREARYQAGTRGDIQAVTDSHEPRTDSRPGRAGPAG